MAKPGDRFGRWQVTKRIGSGGQGAVYKAFDSSGMQPEGQDALALQQALQVIQSEINKVEPQLSRCTPLLDVITRIARPAVDTRVAAVKELLPFEDAVASDDKVAIARMKNEIETLRSIDHPALLKVLDVQLDKRWFAMEYFPIGPMSKRPSRFNGNTLDALVAIRPVIHAVSELHNKKIVHRDIKPDNIFTGADGRLVLGDCGLALKLENQDRLTLTFENVGTRDYQPPWTYGMRVEDVRPNFDVFGLAKVIWAMISGRPRFPLEDFDVAPHDLRTMFPDDPGVLFVHRLFKKCIVRREPQCQINDANELLTEVDRTIRALRAGAILPTTKHKMLCRFCGLGNYKGVNSYDATGDSQFNQHGKFYVCDHCGHLEMFGRVKGSQPPAWNDE